MKAGALKAFRAAAAALCATALAVFGLGFAAPAAWADEADEPIGRLSIIATFAEGEPFWDGHSYLSFVSYQDDLHLQFTNLFGYYEFTDSFKEAVKEDPSVLASDKVGEDNSEIDNYFTTTIGDPIDQNDPRYHKIAYDCALDRGEFITIGDYTMAGGHAEMAMDLFLHSSAWNDLVAIANSELNEGYTKEGIIDHLAETVDKYLDNELSLEEAKAETEAYLTEALSPEGAQKVKELLEDSKIYDGSTTGGIFVNRELWRQKSWQNLTPNQVYSIEVTRAEMDDLLAFLNYDPQIPGEAPGANNYSWVCNNCSNVSSSAWNAAVGYVRDENGEKTDTKSDLYMDAYDDNFPLIPCFAATPQRIFNVIKSWGDLDLGGTAESWDYIPQVVLPEDPEDPEDPEPGPEPGPEPEPEPDVTPEPTGDTEANPTPSVDSDAVPHAVKTSSPLPGTGDQPTSVLFFSMLATMALGIGLGMRRLSRKNS